MSKILANFRETDLAVDFFDDPIDEKWLKACNLEFRKIKGDSCKHWFLWIGNTIPGAVQFFGAESLGIEIAQEEKEESRWFCWLVQNHGRPNCEKSIFMRFLFNKGHLIELVEALTGQEWNPNLVINGVLYSENTPWPVESNVTISRFVE